MEEISTQSTIMLLPSTNEQARSFANDLISQVDNGSIDILKLSRQIKFIEKTLELVKQGTKENLIKYTERLADKDIAEVAHTAKYDYSHCQDYEWDYYEEKIYEFRELQKEREKKLKLINSSEIIEYTNPTTGEIGMNKVNAPIKKYYEFVKIK
jgi:gentisate 1,2-dioxygenase